ncbi:hypothetical protein AS189_15730 [Arthrobacter alpinus]|uniref:CD-NTase-associated protein 12/Pycsar effector protein TIR domain-containing protein n=1 Tax=Arthrobacter alpinus TaxID=656366 RepID=A0A0S2M1U3_9MICC|nr:nucleotide-binding protein [Arthrobacter alpinus]ALO67663.1 hypothetical protein AS189_15730 [Arthrobacter alpinus]
MYFFTDAAPSGSDLGRTLVDPFAEFWSNGDGPAHSVIDRKIAAAGLPKTEGSKQQKIIDAFLRADDAQAYALMKGLLDALRRHSNSFWSKDSEQADEAKAHLHQVLQDAGYSLEEDFKLSEEQRKPAPKSVPPAVQERLGQVPKVALITAKEIEAVHQAETNTAPPREIFLVHGHQDGLRREVSEWVQESVGVTPVVLSKQLSGGKTLIEKFESYSADAACAIVIMTPDDEARAKNNLEAIEERARQNVVFELGYFYGKLRRENVIVLNFGVELPGDIKGMVDVRGQDWKIELLKELAGLGYKSNF